MKKLFPVLLVLLLASLLLVGCLPTTPTEGEGEGEEQTGIAICPDVSVTSQETIGIKNYIRPGLQTITITFPVPTEPVSVYVGDNLKDTSGPVEVIIYANADKTVYNGTFDFGKYPDDCAEAYIYVDTCSTCSSCKYPYTMDTTAPDATIEICLFSCSCAGCSLSFESTTASSPCTSTANCGDACSGLSGWSVTLYEQYPFDNCCDASCEAPVYTASGTTCPIECVTDCLSTGTYYAIATLTDAVGNDVTFGTRIDWDPEGCDTLILTELDSHDCLDNPKNSFFTVCAENAGYWLSTSASLSSGGTATDQTGKSVYMSGETVSILAEPATNYKFVNWTAPFGTFADANSLSTTFTMPAADVTVTANFDFAEDFTGLTSGIPSEWTWTRPENVTGKDNWYVSISNNAGGSAPQMLFNCFPEFTGKSRLITPTINTSGASGLTLSFKHYVSHWDVPYTLKVQVSTDAGITWEDPVLNWQINPTGNIGPETITVDLSDYDGETIQIAWFFEGKSGNINWWCIDDIVVTQD